MIEIIAILLAGIAVGRICIRGKIAAAIAARMNVTVWILIFALGLSIGSDPTLVRAIPEIGTEAAMLAALATGGSMAAAVIAMKIFDRKR